MTDFWVIRGSRVLQQLNELSTVPKLIANIDIGFPETKKRQHSTNQVSIHNIQYLPYVGMKMLHIKSTSSSNGNAYKQAIQFLKVEFTKTNTQDTRTFTATDAIKYNVFPIKLDTNNIKVRCSCMDFHYRFANYNAQDKSLVSIPPPVYVKKTNRPPVNPLQVPGVCKHLLKLIDQLTTTHLII